MSTPTRVAAFVAGLALLFVAAFGLGRVLNPESRGYELHLAASSLEPGARTIAFTIDGPDGAPVTSYDVLHGKRLHLIVVRHDLSGYQHLHPVLDDTGRWSVPASLTSGPWRVIADFEPTGGARTTLGAELEVAGDYRPAELPPESEVATVDGFTVRRTGELTADGTSMLTVSVSHRGRPVTDLDPYLGSYGHLVMLRTDDLSYVHVHPEEGPPGPDLRFHVEGPGAGTFRLFFDFQYDGVVRTAEFTADASSGDEGMDDMEGMGGEHEH